MAANETVLVGLLLVAKVTLVLGAALLLTSLMRRRSAAERHAVWTLAVAGVLALPLLAAVSPSWRVPLQVPAWASAARGVVPAAARPVPPTPPVRPAPAPVRPARVPAPAPPQPPVLAPATAPPPAATPAPATAPAPVHPARASTASAQAPLPPPAPRSVPQRSGMPSMPAVLLVVWLAGLAVGCVRLALGLWRVARMTRGTRPLTDAVLLTRAWGIAGSLGVSRSLRVLEGPADAMPVTFGVLRPVLLLPSSARSWSARRQATVLRHELAHVRRGDSLIQLMAEIACAVYWFNPLIWIAARRLCMEREHACDDQVLAAGARASDYATELLDLARTLRAPVATAAAIAMARESHLRQRLEAVLDEDRSRRGPGARLMVPAWLGVLAVVTPLSAVSFDLHPRVRAGAPDDVVASGVAAGVSENRAAAHGTVRASVPPSAPLSAAAVSSGGTGSSPAAGSLPAELHLPAQSRDCLDNGRNTSVNSNASDHRYTFKWSGTGCSGELLFDGEVRFNADFTAIEWISRGGRVRIDVDENGTRRRLEITPDGGGLSYDYAVNNRRQAWDAEGERWLQSMLLFTFRRLGYQADERARSILARGGADALFGEIDLLRGDWPRARYFAVLVQDSRLDAAQLQRALRAAGSTLKSDYYRHEVVTALVGAEALDAAARAAYIAAVADISSDYYRQSAYSQLLKRGGLTPAQVASVLRDGGAIQSDYYRAELLREVAVQYADEPEIRRAYLDAARGIGSDYYKTAALTELMTGQPMRDADIIQLLEAARSIGSEHYRSTLLVDVAGRHRLQGDARARYLDVADGLKSETYRGRAASALLRQERQ